MRFFKTAALILCAFVCAAAFWIFNSPLAFEESESYTFFCGNTSANCREVTVHDNAALKKLALKDVNGESTFYSTLDVQKFLEELGAEVIFTEQLEDSLNLYCSADLPYSTELYGHEINLHVCIKDEGVKVGSPIIFGGY